MTKRKQLTDLEAALRECHMMRINILDAEDKIKALEADLADARKAAAGWEAIARQRGLSLDDADRAMSNLHEKIATITRQLDSTGRANRRVGAHAEHLTRTQRGLVAALAAAGAEIIAAQDMELDREEEG